MSADTILSFTVKVEIRHDAAYDMYTVLVDGSPVAVARLDELRDIGSRRWTLPEETIAFAAANAVVRVVAQRIDRDLKIG